MPRNKDLKRLVRARMSKTGESYTAARAHVLAKSRSKPRTTRVARRRVAQDVRRARAASELCRACGLQRRGAQGQDRMHVGAVGRRARLLRRRQDGASRHRGPGQQEVQDRGLVVAGRDRRLRAHQGAARARSAARWQLRSQQVAHLQRAGRRRCSTRGPNARVRGRWLDGEIGKVRTSTAAKSMRLDGKDGSIVAVGFWPKGPSKSAVSVQHTKLRDQETATKLKKYWSERLDALRDVLTP